MVEKNKIDSDPFAISPQYLACYIKGNVTWPQKHFVHPLLIAAEAIGAGDRFGELIGRHFSEAQLERVSRVMNLTHGHNVIDRVYSSDDLLQPDKRVVPEAILKLWPRAVVEGANWTIALARLTTSLSAGVSALPDLRESNRTNAQKMKDEIDVLDILLKSHSNGRAELSSLFSSVLSFLGGREFKQYATLYRRASSTAHNAGSEIFTINGEEGTKTYFTQLATDNLIKHLQFTNSQYDWSTFTYNY